MSDLTQQLTERIRQAAAQATPLKIHGGHTKAFYGQQAAGEPLDLSGHIGIVNYEPTELIVTARSGTRLADLEAELAQQGQMLAFEPPHYGAAATVGGCVAAGLSGPRRATAGAVRDFMLGVRLLDGRGQDLRFGGEVMKNVAGFDVARTMAGSLGTLGVLLEVSMKVVPKPAQEVTRVLEMALPQALSTMQGWGRQSLPVSATCQVDNKLYVRLSGARTAVAAAAARIGGEALEEAEAFWASVREQSHGFFQAAQPLWRLSLPATTPVLALDAPVLTEWGGALRWVHSALDAATLRRLAQDAGGHATLFRPAGLQAAVFTPLSAGLMTLHRRLKAQFDPQGIFNPGRLYPDL